MKTSKIALSCLFWLTNFLLAGMIYSVLQYFIFYFPNTIRYWDILVSAYGSWAIALVNTVSFITLMVFSFVPVFAFRNFINNLKKEMIFTVKNLNLLKKITIGLLVIDLIHVFQYAIFLPTMNIESLPAKNMISFQIMILFFALLMWGLRLILLKGVHLKSENDLTV